MSVAFLFQRLTIMRISSYPTNLPQTCLLHGSIMNDLPYNLVVKLAVIAHFSIGGEQLVRLKEHSGSTRMDSHYYIASEMNWPWTLYWRVGVHFSPRPSDS